MAESTKSLSFDGTGYVDISGIWAVMPANNHAATLACWAKFTSFAGTPQYELVEIGDMGTNKNGLRLLCVGADLFGQTGDGARHSCIATGALSTGAWLHLAFVYDGAGGMKLYVNGSLVQTAGSGAWSAPGSTVAYLGQETPGDSRLIGLLDDVAVWSVALSATDVTNLAAGTTFPQSISGIVGLWHAEEGSGTTTADSSGNGNTGTFTGGVTWSSDVPSQLAGGGGGGVHPWWAYTPPAIIGNMG